jgi:hypothetical protein
MVELEPERQLGQAMQFGKLELIVATALPPLAESI